MEQGKIAAVHSESKWASRHYWGDFDTIFAGSDTEDQVTVSQLPVTSRTSLASKCSFIDSFLHVAFN
jgi:hypothetical protein